MQVWIDSPVSLTMKFAFAKEANARGVGVWSGNYLNYNSSESGEFWQSFRAFTG